jgi:hypothetical protein
MPLPTFDIEAVNWTIPIAIGFFDGFQYIEFVKEDDKDEPSVVPVSETAPKKGKKSFAKNKKGNKTKNGNKKVSTVKTGYNSLNHKENTKTILINLRLWLCLLW